MSRIVVCDTGPLLHLSEAGAIQLLKLAGKVLISPAIGAEFKRNASDRELPNWVKTQRLDAEARGRVSVWMHRQLVDSGEAEAIALSIQIQCDWFLTDDAQARQFGESLGLEVHGSVGLLLWAVAAGHVDSREQAHRILNGLMRSTLWISDRVLREAAKAIDDLLEE